VGKRFLCKCAMAKLPFGKVFTCRFLSIFALYLSFACLNSGVHLPSFVALVLPYSRLLRLNLGASGAEPSAKHD
jgi:hypothetical protein